ncbi:MAG: hypothetical protein HY520_00245 [Candidatus Aenigmarchaeota archaeon]|nr:hypothetical protein [Candidatus Aenigmarchaeota archaeon]
MKMIVSILAALAAFAPGGCSSLLGPRDEPALQEQAPPPTEEEAFQMRVDQQELDSLRARVADLEQRLQTSLGEALTLRSQLADARRQASQNQADLASLREGNAALETRLSAVTGELARAKRLGLEIGQAALEAMGVEHE